MQSLKKMIKLVPLGNTMGVEHIPYSPNAVRAFRMEIIVGIEMLAHSPETSRTTQIRNQNSKKQVLPLC